MSAISLTGSDVIQIDDRVLSDFSGDTPATITFPNDIAAAKVSKNGNIVYALNNTGLLVEFKIRLLLGSSDDKYVNSRLQEMKNNFSSFILLTGMFCKVVGDGAGNTESVVYQCSGGVFKRQVDAKSSASGDTEQSETEYTMLFRNDSRSVQ